MADSAVITLGPAVIKEALVLAAAGAPDVWIRTDSRGNGLQIRVEGNRAVWMLRVTHKGKTLSRTLGEVLPDQSKISEAQRAAGLRNVGEARTLAGEMRDRFIAGFDTSPAWVAARRLGQDASTADRAAATKAHVEAGSWTYGDLVERYVAEVVSVDRVTKRKEIKPAKAKAIADARRYLLYPTTKTLHGRLVRDLKKADLEGARNEARAMGKSEPQRKLVTYFKAAMTWAQDKHDSASGLEGVAPWWLKLTHFDMPTKSQVAGLSGGKQPTLTAKHAARLLFVAEQHRVAPGRQQRHATSEVVLAALWWLVLGVQRSHASASVLRSRVYAPEDGVEWWNVEFSPLDVKSGRWHTLSLSPRVYNLTLGRALAAPDRREGSAYVFPSTTTKDRGKDTSTDRPIDDSTLNSLIGRLRGKRAPARDGGPAEDGEDLLEGVPHFGPHKLRTALTTELSDMMLPPGAASAVLDHATGSDGQSAEAHVESEVTRRHYNRSPRAALKLLALEAWADRVLAEYVVLTEAHRAKLAAEAKQRRSFKFRATHAAASAKRRQEEVGPQPDLPPLEGEVMLERPEGYFEENELFWEERQRLADIEFDRAAAEIARIAAAAASTAKPLSFEEGFKRLQSSKEEPSEI